MYEIIIVILNVLSKYLFHMVWQKHWNDPEFAYVPKSLKDHILSNWTPLCG